MTDLSAFAANVHSQYGEDGILSEIYRRLGVTAGFFVEFGAWDGMHLSNSYALVEAGWSGCYIEGDPDRFRTLCDNLPQATVRKVQRSLTASTRFAGLVFEWRRALSATRRSKYATRKVPDPQVGSTAGPTENAVDGRRPTRCSATQAGV